ncbi:hypothetical protein SAMN05421773_1115 [Streptomyces aidingensis]|uniref:Tetratricopeptide repeat-containing protein n=1 Tax=Streptomyces aidingensis TaxID=910347 RepID=A0A1I1QJI3_9ACTN|nr:hypothetical protein SAMN05421773_1115 [Streptomyces aidingensis]
MTATDIAPAEIDDLELAVHRLGATYSAHPPQALWPVAAGHRLHADSLLQRRHTLRQGRELAHLAGMLSVILAWLAHDLGRTALVPTLGADAWHHGEQAGSPEVSAWSQDVVCTDALYAERPLDALTAATRGLAVAPAGSNAAIRLTAQLARAQAVIGNRSGFAEAAVRAHAFREHIPLRGTGLFAVDAMRIVSYDATSHGRLGNHERARAAAEEAIRHYAPAAGPGHAPTRLAIARLDLATAHAALGEPEGAISTARQALTGDRVVQSVKDRARLLGRTLLLRYPDLPEARAFHEELPALAGPPGTLTRS